MSDVKTLKGTWRFNDVLTAPVTGFEAPVQFECTNTAWAMIICEGDGVGFFIGYANADVSNYIVPFVTADIVETVSSNLGTELVAGWQSTDYQTIDFGTEPQYVSADFYNWLTANATKQVGDITITIEGGKSKRLLVAGTLPRKNIVVTALGGGVASPAYDGSFTKGEI